MATGLPAASLEPEAVRFENRKVFENPGQYWRRLKNILTILATPVPPLRAELPLLGKETLGRGYSSLIILVIDAQYNLDPCNFFSIP